MKLDRFGHPTRVVVDTGPLLDTLFFLTGTGFDRQVLRFENQVRSFLDFLHSREVTATTTAVVVEIATHLQKRAKKTTLVSIRREAAQLLVKAKFEELAVRVLTPGTIDDFAALGPADASLMQACREHRVALVTADSALVASCARASLPVTNVYTLLP